MGIKERLVKSTEEKIKVAAENAASAVVDGALRAVFAWVSLIDPTRVLPTIYMLWTGRDRKNK